MVKLNEYLTAAEAAAHIGCCADTLRRWDRAKRLSARRHPVTGYRLYLPPELDEFLRQVRGVDKKLVAKSRGVTKPSKLRSRKRKG